MINTYGKIILENGKKVYKRFGAAAKQKIKLGTAAFANLVNNLTTTEEGSALDARVGPVIDGRLSKNEADISSLNSAIRNFALWSKTIPKSGMSIADLPEGIYNLSSYGITSLTDSPSGFSSDFNPHSRTGSDAEFSEEIGY